MTLAADVAVYYNIYGTVFTHGVTSRVSQLMQILLCKYAVWKPLFLTQYMVRLFFAISF